MMDVNNWRPAQGEQNPSSNSNMDGVDWRAQLTHESRERIVNKIMETLKRHLPISGPEGLVELRKIAVRFEEKIYTAATNQNDYLRKISMKMLTMETKSQPNGGSNSLPSNSSGGNQNPQDPASHGIQSQVRNQGLSSSTPPQARQQQLLSQSLQNTIGSSGIQGSPSLPPAIPSMTGLPQTSMSSVVGQSNNLQNMSGISQSSISNSVGQGLPSNMFPNSQRQMQGRQQQSQNPQQILYQHQFQQQLLKQKLQQGNMQSLMQMSSGQSSQPILQQTQPSMMQAAPQSVLQSNQQSFVQQSAPSVLQQHQQSVLRQQQQSQQLMGQQTNGANIQQNPLLGQQKSVPDIQQQRLIGQQNNISNMQQHQQLLGPQNISNLHQQQHSMHLLQQQQQAKVAAQQHQTQQGSSALLPSQGPQSQAQPPPQQLVSQLQSQPTQLQQQLAMQQQPSSLQREMQQRVQTSSAALLQTQNAIDQQKQLFQSQCGLPEASSTTIDSTTQTGLIGVVDWQEEVYQKIKSMKEMYFPELNELFQKFDLKCKQLDSVAQRLKQSLQVERLKLYRNTLEHFIAFLQLPKSNILPAHKEKLALYEEKIIHMVNSNRPKKPASSHQQGQQHGGQMHLMPQQPPSQIPRPHQIENHVNQMQHGPMPLPTHLGVTTTQQNMMNSLQSGSNLESSAQGNALQQGVIGSFQQNAMGPLQQSAVNAPPQQASINTLSQNSVNQLQSNINLLQPNSNMLQHQHLKQEMQTQQLKQQFQQLHMQQQLVQQQQKQLHQQQKSTQLPAHQMPQLNQLNDANELKVRQGTSIKPGLFQQNHPASQHPTYHQQLKMPGAPFPIPSPQLVQGGPSPQISQNSSPQIDQQSLLASLPKAGTPLSSANSPFIVPSPSTPLAPSPMPGDPEKPQPSGISSASYAGTIGLTQPQSLAIGTPGMSASPLLAEFTAVDGHRSTAPTVFSATSSVTEQPLERLIKAVKSLSPKAFSSSVCDMGSVVSMMDGIARSAPGNGSRAAVGEDLVAMTKCRLQANNFISQDGSSATKKMRLLTSAMPLNAVSSAGSVNDSFKQLYSLETSDLESTATSRIKRHRVQANDALLEEISQINQRLIDTVVEICEEDIDSIAAVGEGSVVKCSFTAVTISHNLKSQMAPILPLRLLVPPNYPNCSPILLDKLPVESSKDFEDLSVKAKSRFSISLRSLSQPMSLGDMVRTWDVCTRKVITEYAQQSGGGSFSSRYGTWESCFTS
ncbi:mediator of RNA polymerase II transcription subunit 15a-like [Tasmannia lanceolata]|uniref:mediator of RNA polymerase II transcription subunit 15a-like n=1 Tax=Tasmannia lanceolata TaxID=3420 RepID=UPI004062B6BC